MVVHRRDRRGRCRRAERYGTRLDSIGGRRLRRRSPPRAGGVLDPRYPPALGDAFRWHGGRSADAPWPRGLRAGAGRPVLSRRGQLIVAARVASRNPGRARPVRLQHGGVAPAVAAAANGPALTVRPFARSHPSAFASWDANPGAYLRPACARAAGTAIVRYRLWALAAHGARIARRSARTHPRIACSLLQPRAHRVSAHRCED